MSRIEVLKVVAHLVITLVVVIGYIAIFLIKGHQDELLKGATMLIMGYWFGKIEMPSKKKGSGKSE